MRAYPASDFLDVMAGSKNSNFQNKNLKPLNTRTKSEQREIAKKGGKKSGEVRRAKKAMREILDYLLEKEVTNGKGDKITTKEAIAIALLKKAAQGDVKAFEVLRDTIGEKPIEQHNITQIEPPRIIDDV